MTIYWSNMHHMHHNFPYTYMVNNRPGPIKINELWTFNYLPFAFTGGFLHSIALSMKREREKKRHKNDENCCQFVENNVHMANILVLYILRIAVYIRIKLYINMNNHPTDRSSHSKASAANEINHFICTLIHILSIYYYFNWGLVCFSN